MIGADNCPFCGRAEKDEFDFSAVGAFLETISFEPLNPVTPGHRLFLPKTHIAIDDHLWEYALGDCIAMVRIWREHDGLPPGDFNLILNGGISATQTIEHMHLHYVPRLPGDGLTLPWTGQIVH